MFRLFVIKIITNWAIYFVFDQIKKFAHREHRNLLESA